MKRYRNFQEIGAGLVIAAVGVAAMIVARDYPFGTVVRMGPGFVPIMLGALLVVLGLGAAFLGRGLPAVSLDLHLRPAVLILGGILVWVVLVDWLGFVPATFALVAISAQAERDIKLHETAALAAGLTLVGYVLFIRGLQIPIAAFGS
ncbi:tripartite tricarboxylate transporter TctB family protein [Acuticoccus sediminis]|uniref:Tripartite tricarboxylate transporter TctB family protein n=1 Tax=Acuticoccus sediminis TaxID=2184697 RepID=A0A8B2NV83_9HYPH|nr:tripartite tricarboxylate transporter TctB family protein [Acuticoccus sediminis]RAI02218.1 tripartite tricarboxylate transporter TctB family protein [Acuticoccus sediminis]